MNIDTLTQWVGKHVRTEDQSMYNCGTFKHPGSIEHNRGHKGFCFLTDMFGGQGWVVAFDIDEHGRVYLLTDEGLSWLITARTHISEAPSSRPIDQDAVTRLRELIQ